MEKTKHLLTKFEYYLQITPFTLIDYKTVFQVGAENLFNEYYSTYADWGNIPRMGRNIFTSLKINL